MRKRRNAFQSASWLWTPIGGSPTLDANSATWVGYLSAGGKQRILNLFDYGVTLIPGSVIPAVDTTTPRYAVVPSNVPAWGSNPFAGNSIPLPAAAQSLIPPGSDKHVAVLDLGDRERLRHVECRLLGWHVVMRLGRHVQVGWQWR